jgi:hypothetical protein
MTGALVPLNIPRGLAEIAANAPRRVSAEPEGSGTLL